MDTTNDFLVGIQANHVVILAPPRRPITKAEALRLAAHIVVMADDKNEFAEVLKAVMNT